MAPLLKSDVDNGEDDSSSHSSSISSPSKYPTTKTELLGQKHESDGAQHEQGDCKRTVNSTNPDTIQQIGCRSIHPRFPRRSRSVPSYPNPSRPNSLTTMIDEVNGLKSLSQAWEKKYTVANNLSESSTTKGLEDEPGSFPTEDALVFPFFHLDYSHFIYYQYIFPFSHLDPCIFEFEPENKRRPSPLVKLMKMVGLEEVKRHFLSVRDRVKAAQALEKMPPIRSLELDLIITGSYGTGKTRIAGIYMDYLLYLGIDCRGDSNTSKARSEEDKAYIIDVNGSDPLKSIFDKPSPYYNERDLLKILVRGYGAQFLRVYEKYQNVHTLQDEIRKILCRQAKRLEKAIQVKTNMVVHITDRAYELTESDFFGDAWKKLERMTGMEKIKDAIKGLVSMRNINYGRERAGEKPLRTSHNYVFLGPPGTGKTTVASLFGQVIAGLGFIENSTVCIGDSEATTRKILRETEDKVLIIDEAHMFYLSTEYNSDGSDIYRKGIVDTIVAHVDNEPESNRCIILTGYPDRMKERFPLEDAFVFENYDAKALDGIAATDDAKSVAMEVLQRERELPNFGNGGAVRNLISRALATYNKRTPTIAPELWSSENEQSKIVLEPYDFEPEYDRGLRTQKDYRSLFKDLVGFQEIISVFEGYQTMTANMIQYGLDPREEVPFSFVFKGPPGTGKTTTARALGHIYYSMGFLCTTEVVDCSVTDLVGTAVGHTGPKVQNLLEKALGKVLFIDEAYRMGQTINSGGFKQEAVGELVDCMTKEKFAHKLVIVLAGYEGDMDKLMAMNEGMRGRFTEMVFPNMRPTDCLRLLQKKLDGKKIKIVSLEKQGVQDKIISLFESLSKTKAWANARDVESISKRLVRHVFMSKVFAGEHVELPPEEIVTVLSQLLRERATFVNSQRDRRSRASAGFKLALPAVNIDGVF
ncbi:P-loop containing nucleoside triphosphate hydrolase protein [Annulohypoxylon maeteangense]|uniref:P-loop containing nucleoside triphosphate hydrolase protein n=1 Tax=Annulohypoxylon maeteangense TaxID=1927788 RepID=UPI002007E4DF|nr:P-loop containing nucleoside triphosphate hydrolase protein [Annulohypoxylon maeteangense]KAI0883955.1 P-loop containing nucleoside triphosphate hydrolase protein [Annulohypoxylon maeteangense]